MALPRLRPVIPNTSGYYHCVSRCVRRAWLCGKDPLTGHDYEGRRQWIEDRMLLLAEAFSVSIYAYAVMSNHLHVVLKVDAVASQRWTDEEVAERWCKVYPGSDDASAQKARLANIAAAPELVAKYRERLRDLSWFMRCLNEPIARRANREDGCTGHFWEGRFKVQVLLDERALLAAMVYADLNPVRAKMTTSLQKSEHTSIQRRIQLLKGQPLLATHSVQPIAGAAQAGLNLQANHYIALVDHTGRQWHQNKKGRIPEGTRSVLSELKIDPEQWQEQVRSFGTRQITAMGTVEALLSLAIETGRAWVVGLGLAKLLSRPARAF